MIYSIFKKTKRRLTTGIPVRRENTIFTECSADQQAILDHKTSHTFFFWALACDKCSHHTSARVAKKGTLDLTDTGQELPARSPLPHALSHPPTGFMALGFHPPGPMTLPTTN